MLTISVDVEDWPQSTWDRSLPITKRSLDNLYFLLDLFAEYEQQSSMFVLGKFAEKFPEAVRRISQAGHEVASHGYAHLEIFHQTRDEFRHDVAHSKMLLEDILGEPVLGYRAPDFSMVKNTTWALGILAELGFRYDSSIFPIQMSRYGIANWPVEPHAIRLPSGNTLVELPITTTQLLGRRLPIAGGGYHRLLPYRFIEWAIRRALKQERSFMLYCHPYEFDASEFDNLPFTVPFKTRLHQGVGRKRFEHKFRRLLKHFQSTPAAQIALGRSWPVRTLPVELII